MKQQRFLRNSARHLGAAPLASLSDSTIWNTAVTPMVKGFLGPRLESFSRVFETTEGLFAGVLDEEIHDPWRKGPAGNPIRYVCLYRDVVAARVRPEFALPIEGLKPCRFFTFRFLDTGACGMSCVPGILVKALPSLADSMALSTSFASSTR